jgi:hypothetical protein
MRPIDVGLEGREASARQGDGTKKSVFNRSSGDLGVFAEIICPHVLKHAAQHVLLKAAARGRARISSATRALPDHIIGTLQRLTTDEVGSPADPDNAAKEAISGGN